MKALFVQEAYLKLRRTAELASKYLSREVELDGTSEKAAWCYEITGYLLGRIEKDNFVIEDIITPDKFELVVPYKVINNVKGDYERNLLLKWVSIFKKQRAIIPHLYYLPLCETISNAIGGFHSHPSGVKYSEWGETGDKIAMLSCPNEIEAIISYFNKEFSVAVYKPVNKKIRELKVEVHKDGELAKEESNSIEQAIMKFDKQIRTVEKRENAIPWSLCGAGIIWKRPKP